MIRSVLNRPMAPLGRIIGFDRPSSLAMSGTSTSVRIGRGPVSAADLSTALNLPTIVALGRNQTEDEPAVVLLIFSPGKLVITDTTDKVHVIDRPLRLHIVLHAPSFSGFLMESPTFSLKETLEWKYKSTIY
jgi:hypothetical protein